jgi:predicted dehydrogenase
MLNFKKKIGVIGLGSMGKRRVRDLLKLGCEVNGFDIRADRCLEARKIFEIDTVKDFKSLLKFNLDAVIISTPPDIHFDYYQKCFENGIPFFSEANILTPKAEWFNKKMASSKVLAIPSATWHFHPSFNFLKKNLSNPKLKVNSVHYHYAGYLPFWHPYEKYYSFYAGRKKTSAAREMVPFEMEALVYIFGPVKQVCAVYGSVGEWKNPIDDHYYIMIEFESGVTGTLIIELHEVSPYRRANISCDSKSFIFDGNNHLVREFDLKSQSYKIHYPPSKRTLGSFDFEELYFEEMKHFLLAITGKKKFSKDWEEDRHLSNILYAAEESMKEKCWVKISEVEDLYSGQKL